MFVPIGDSNHKGNLAELAIAKSAAELGIGVYKPLTEHGRCDLIFEVGERLRRVQCKWARRSEDVLVVQTGSSYHSPTKGYVRRSYSAKEIDGFAAYCGDNDTCYFIPVGEVEGMAAIHMRLAPTRNGQLAGVRMAFDYELGAIAQLEERRHGMAEAAGSSPASSTPPHDAAVVGAHEFRNRFGLFMQRAAAGETFYVTRFGKPFCRLTPPESGMT